MHSANRLALWLWLISFLPWFERLSLFLLAIGVSCAALVLARARLVRALLRLKWLLLVMTLIYGWSTPGQYVWSGWLAPTQEGLAQGVEQSLRLLITVASLQLLLTSMDKNALFSGLYVLAKPLDWLRLDRVRLALRLQLTMEMAEALLEEKRAFRNLLSSMQPEREPTPKQDVSLLIQSLGPWQEVLLWFLLGLMVFSHWLNRFGGW